MRNFFRAPRHKRQPHHHPGHIKRVQREQGQQKRVGREGSEQNITTGNAYYWCTCVYRGKRYLLGAYGSEWEAQSKGSAQLPCDFKVIPLNTRDEATASRMLKAQLLDDGSEFGESTRRLRHR